MAIILSKTLDKWNFLPYQNRTKITNLLENGSKGYSTIKRHIFKEDFFGHRLTISRHCRYFHAQIIQNLPAQDSSSIPFLMYILDNYTNHINKGSSDLYV